MSVPYQLLCALIGFGLGWIPMFLHGPIPEKFNLFYLKGSVAVWSWYTARLMVGVWVGMTCWPRRWWIRGPLCGFLAMLPPGIMSLSVPTCGPVCMFWNEATATVIGLLVAGIAFRLTGKNHALDSAPAEAPAAEH
ncbi:MAG: hypothetical protein ABIR79_01610 [Candidatus Binatia bacterium]